MFSEDIDTSLHIVDDDVFITDEDIDPQIVSITVDITNAQLDISQEFLSFSQDPPEEVAVTGENTHVIVLSVEDPSLSTTRDFFITTLLRLRYINIADEPGGLERVIQFTISDGLLTNDPIAVTTISILEVNDVPVVDLNGDNDGRNVIVEYTEADPPTLIAPQATLQDPDSPTLTQLTIGFEPFDSGNESVAVDLSVLPLASNITCSVQDCNGTNLVLSGTADREDYQILLRTLSYVNVKQPLELPNLRDRFVTVQVSDEASLSASGTEIQIDFLANQSRVIIQLDVPEQDYFTEYTEGQSGSISVVGDQIRIVDTSLETLQSVDVTIRNNLPGEIRETGEEISIDTAKLAGLEIGIEIHTILKRITFSGEAPLDDYLTAIRNVRYENREDEPNPMTRIIDFVVDPGGGAPQDFAFTNITIINVNDHSPMCRPEVQTAFVREDTVPVEQIYTLVATDADVGIGASVTYEQIEGDESLFSTSSSGSVSLLDMVNFEDEKHYSIVVEACDDGIIPARYCCNFTLLVNVTDFNDNEPMFSDDSYTFSVSENLVTDIATFTITDDDSGTNAEIVELSIVTSSYNPVSGCMGFFSTSVNPPTLSTASGLDYEARTTCQFTITATDGGGVNALSGSATITINVLNEDDFPPVFTMESFAFSVEEENTFPQVIGQVEANDIDSPGFGFSLPNTTDFDIDSTSGVIRILFSTDYDMATNYTFVCVATDPNSNTATAQVTVTVNPINNDPPTLDLNATDPDSVNVFTPVVFVEESGQPVTLLSDPLITDPDQVVLVISEIRASIANSRNPSEEELSLPESVSSLYIDLSPVDSSVLVIEPTNPTRLDDVYELIQSIAYTNYEDEISSCDSSLYQCLLGNNSRTVLIGVHDGENYSPERELYVIFEAINDPPELDLNTIASGTGHRAVFQEGQGPVHIVNVGFVSLTDDDNALLTFLECNLTNPVDGTNEFLTLNGTISNGLMATISADGYTVTVTGIAGTLSYTEAISLIQYNSTTSNPTDILRVIDCYTSDGIAESNVATAEVVFDTVNEMPSLDLDDQSPTVNHSIDYIEEGGAVRVSGEVILADEDDTTMGSLTITLLGAASAGETIALDPAYTLPSPLTVSSSASSLTISGLASIATYKDVIMNVVYDNTDGEIPDISDRSVQFIVQDDGGADSDPVYTTISVIPVDDNPPTFEEVPDSFRLLENTTNGTQVGTLQVIDLDEPPGRDVPTFSIYSSQPILGLSDFYIVNNPLNLYEAVIHVSDGNLIDYDNRATSYSLVILANSGLFNANISINISVINLPDLDPVFTTFPTVFQVSENEVLNTPLSPSRVIAIDPDGLDAIEYDISGNELGGVPLIDIDSITGVLRVEGNIDREIHGSEFEVTIIASDSNSMVSRGATVEILGMNEFAPTFSVPKYLVLIEENEVPSSEAITTVSATDVDAISEQRNITYSISQDSGSHLFDINSTSGAVFQLLPVDYEEFSIITLVVEANDNDNTPIAKTSTALVEITVGNVNDEAPIFYNLPTLEPVVVSELTSQHATVFTVEFDDPDINSDLRFTPLVSEHFAISENGEVTVITTSLDADEGQRDYTFVIELTDLNTAPMFSSNRTVSAQLNITLEDKNDVIPEFSSNSFEGNVMENLEPRQPVVQVTAIDGDYGFTPNGDTNGNNIVAYMLGVDAPNGIFTINNETGLINTTITLNREQQAEYVFTVIVQDSPINESANFHTTQVRITVIDENEHPPEADPNQYYIFVEENSQPFLQTFAASQWTTEGKWQQSSYTLLLLMANIAESTYSLVLLLEPPRFPCILHPLILLSTAVEPGMYLRQLKEASLTDPSIFVVLCQFLTVAEDSSISLEEVTYMDGENCVNTTAEPLWMQTVDAAPISSEERVITVPLSDDTNSDILGVYMKAPNDDTRERYMTIFSIEEVLVT